MTDTQKTRTYHEQTRIDQTIRLREVLKTLPPFAKDYFRAIEPRSSAKTRISYAYDIRVFFHYLVDNNPVYKTYTMDQFTLQDLERLEPVDIEEYMEYLKVYTRENDGELITNGEKGLSRKMSALRSFYNYYFKHQNIKRINKSEFFFEILVCARAREENPCVRTGARKKVANFLLWADLWAI